MSNTEPPQFVLTTPLHHDIENPSSPQIAALLNRLPTADSDADYLIVEKCGENLCGAALSFLQTRPSRTPRYEGMLIVEYRDGMARRQYRSAIEAERAAALFDSYLRDDEQWLGLVIWRDISFHFPDLRATLPPDELAASFFEAGEWQKFLADKQERDDAFWQQLGDHEV